MASGIQATEVIVVRHGETAWNLIGKQQGQLDSPLTDRGIQQANALSKGLYDRGIDALYCSDLGRAAETAKIIAAKLGMPVQSDVRLRERHLGSLQGTTKDLWRRNYPDEWAAFDSGDPDYRFPGGESARDRVARTIECFEELAIRHAGHTILVVAHGGVLNGLLYHVVDIPLSAPRRFSLFNGAINSFLFDGSNWRLESWGETEHLQGLKTLDDN